MANKPGQPHKLTDEVYKLIVEQVGKDISISNAAKVARVHPDTMKNWMERGYNESKMDQKTIFAQFFLDVRQNQGKKVSELLQKIGSGQKNWQGIAWILERCAAEDFGRESELYKQLLEDYKKLVEDMVSRKDLPLQGFVGNGETDRSKAQEDT